MEKKAPFKIELDKDGGHMEARLSDIPRDEVLRYLGYRGQSIGDDLDRQITACIRAVADCAKSLSYVCDQPRAPSTGNP